MLESRSVSCPIPLLTNYHYLTRGEEQRVECKSPPDFTRHPLYYLRRQIPQIASSPEIPHHPAHNVSILRQTRVASSRRIYPCGTLDPFTATASTLSPLPPDQFEILLSCLFVRYSLYAHTHK
ncbi:hypothetical protein CDAR_42771 [Caerostris darwini]|uniref:Uncharacterized protein n=1 Tax=Caerostris darwini TaxID=1538125 RepID=A0AAV4WES2_9ARAC|nr:hypothetical protein CDAR_42771 [Caerostris darwini]